MAQQVVRTVCAVLALIWTGCGGAGWEAPTAPGSVGPAGGTVSFAGGLLVLVFPPNALTEYVTITVTDTTGPAGTTVVPGTVFDIEPSLTFSVPVQVTIRYGSATLPAGVLESELGLYKVVNGAWEKVATSTVDTANKTITALIGGFSTYGILGAPVAAVTVTPATVSVLAGGTTTLSAAAEDAGGTALPNRTITWSTPFASVATVSSSGVVTGVSAGTARITAAVVTENRSGTATVTVSVVPVATVTVSPAALALVGGDTVRLTATTRDSANRVLTGRTVTWASSNVAVATVDGSGLVTAVAAGTVTITATSESVSGEAAITVQQLAVASVTVSPATAIVTVRATLQLTATTKDAGGATLTGRAVNWTSSNVAVATVSSTGLVMAVAAGTDTITATSESVSGTAVVTVQGSGVTILFQDDFEHVGVAHTYGSVSTLSVAHLTISTAVAHSGTQSARFEQGWQAGLTDVQLNFSGLPNVTEAFLQFYLYMPSGTENPSVGPRYIKQVTPGYTPPANSNDKFFRLLGIDYAALGSKVGASVWSRNNSEPEQYLGYMLYDYGVNGSNAVGPGDGTQPRGLFITGANLGRWVRIRIHCKVATAANNDGVIQIWVDDTLLVSATNLNNYPAAGFHNFYTSGFLIGSMNNAALGQMLYLDDFTISTGGFVP